MGELTPVQASTLSLLVKHGQTYGGVAARLGINSLAVRVRAHEAAAVLAGLGPPAPGDGLMIDRVLGQLPTRDVGVLSSEFADREADHQRERLTAALAEFLGTQVGPENRQPAVIEAHEVSLVESAGVPVLESAELPLLESAELPVLESAQVPVLVLEVDEAAVLEPGEAPVLELDRGPLLELDDPLLIEFDELPVLEPDDPAVLELEDPPVMEPAAQPSVIALSPVTGTALVRTRSAQRRRSRAGAARTRAILSLGLGSLAAGVVLLINGVH